MPHLAPLDIGPPGGLNRRALLRGTVALSVLLAAPALLVAGADLSDDEAFWDDGTGWA